jgi:hypothetical protein
LLLIAIAAELAAGPAGLVIVVLVGHDHAPML